MAKQKGSDVLLKLDTTGASNYVTIAGLQNARVQARRALVEVTNQLSTSKHREALEGASIFELSISGEGVFDSAAPTATVESVFRAGTIRNWQAIVPGLGTYQGLFQIVSLEISAAHDKEVRLSVNLESAGPITLT